MQVLNAVRCNVPVIIIHGSGRLADQIALQALSRKEDPAWVPDESDPKLSEILQRGRLHIFNVTERPQLLKELVCQVLAEEASSYAAR